MTLASTIQSKPGPSVLLSPPKRRRNSPSADAPSQNEQVLPQANNQEIWKWTLTSDAIAPCFVRDILTMRDNGIKDGDFFWLGRVPCRNVRILGLVVGVQVYEKRIIYTVDDGTSVIDCFHRQTLPPPSPVKRGRVGKPPSRLLMSPKPIASVGSSVRIVGKVTRWHNSRQVNVDCIELCTSANDEPIHWRMVLSLHKSSYSLSDPFVIPPLPCNTAALVPLPDVAPDVAQYPPKLRHPSRLHSRDLTANTFRIYLKHYMDNAPLNGSPSPSRSQVKVSQEFSDEMDSESSYPPAGNPSTPTKRSCRSYISLNDHTPRPSGSGARTSGQTMKGFTMSYLRRVPELADMARRVVKAEAKRRMLAERKRIKEEALKQEVRGAKVGATSPATSREKNAPKMKRLFAWAIVKLYEEGSIVLWDGPVRVYKETRNCGASGLWKANSTSVSVDETVFSAMSNVANERSCDEDDDTALSDPQPHEEAYVSLTPAYFAIHVEKAIGTLMARSANIPRQKQKKMCAPSSAPGPTKEDIVTFLRRADERWARVGEWAVDEALEVLRREERAWSIGGARWELCL